MRVLTNDTNVDFLKMGIKGIAETFNDHILGIECKGDHFNKRSNSELCKIISILLKFQHTVSLWIKC